MKLILAWTPEIVSRDGHSLRVWKGKTDSGIECFALIGLIAVADQHDQSEFELLLKQVASPVIEAVEIAADQESFASHFGRKKTT